MKKVIINGKECWQMEKKDIDRLPKIPFPKDMLKHNQPERSKREDSVELVYKKPIGPKGKYPEAEKLLRCGALNSMET